LKNGIVSVGGYTAGAVVIAVWHTICAFLSLVFVDIFGRKKLLGIGYLIMLISMVWLAIINGFILGTVGGGILTVICMLAFLFGNDIGVGSIVFLYHF